MANKNLTDLTARTSTDDSDLIHVNSGGTDYKETKANFLSDINSSLANKLDNGTLLQGGLYCIRKSTASSAGAVYFSNNGVENRYAGIMIIESSTGTSAIYAVFYKKDVQGSYTKLAGSDTPFIVNSSTGNIAVTLEAWSTATFICTKNI